MSIKFSIILPTYNCKYLETAINSVINQNYVNWELIVIDNGSSNEALKIIEKKENKKIRYFRIKNKGVIGKSRNFGIKKSKFSWIAFLDSDDFWYKTKLSEIRKKILLTKGEFFYHNMHILSNSKNLINKKLYRYHKKSFDSKFDDLIINGNDIIQSSVVLKKELIKKAGYLSEKRDLIAWEDFDLWLRVSKITNKFYLINKCLGKYFISDDKKTKHERFLKNIKSFKKKFYKDIKKIMKKNEMSKIWWINYAEGLDYYNKGKYFKAKQKLSKLKIRDKKVLLNITFIKFKILLKELI